MNEITQAAIDALAGFDTTDANMNELREDAADGCMVSIEMLRWLVDDTAYIEWQPVDFPEMVSDAVPAPALARRRAANGGRQSGDYKAGVDTAL